MEDNPEAGLNTLPINDEDEPIDYDADGNPIVPERSKIIDPLPPVDHSMVHRLSFHYFTLNNNTSITLPKGMVIFFFSMFFFFIAFPCVYSFPEFDPFTIL